MYYPEDFNLTSLLKCCLLLLGMTFIIQFYIQQRRFYKLAKEIPGPFTLYFLGSLPFILNKEKNFFKTFSNIVDYYPVICKFYIGPFFHVVSKRPEDAEVILNTFIEKGTAYKYFNEPIKNSLLNAPFNLWRKNRKLMNHTFNARNIDYFHEIFVAQSKKFINNLEEESGKEQTDDLMIKIWKRTLAASYETLFDLPCEENDYQNFSAWVLRTEKIMFERIKKPWLHIEPLWKISSLYREAVSVKHDSHSYFYRIINKRLKELPYMIKEDPFRKNLFLNYLIEAKETNAQMTHEQIVEEIFLMLSAASDSSAVAIASTILMLGLHAKVQNKLYEEIISVWGNDKTDLSLEDLNQLEYCERVIKETMRLLPPIPLIVRKIDKEIHLDPYIIPAGANICIPILHLHRDPNIWPDPLKFDPDRFLPEEAAKRHRCSYIPFSFGVRSCIGLKFAMRSMLAFVSYTVKNFKIKTTRCKPIEQLDFDYHIIMKIKDYGVLLEKRETN